MDRPLPNSGSSAKGYACSFSYREGSVGVGGGCCSLVLAILVRGFKRSVVEGDAGTSRKGIDRWTGWLVGWDMYWACRWRVSPRGIVVVVLSGCWLLF